MSRTHNTHKTQMQLAGIDELTSVDTFLGMQGSCAFIAQEVEDATLFGMVGQCDDAAGGQDYPEESYMRDWSYSPTEP